jgi:ubiquinone/menaquinone biosynthesis C-methylase UbiE
MLRSAVNPFAKPDTAWAYEAWYETTGRRADRLEKALFRQMLARFPQASSLLEIGCGTGHFTRWFKELGLRTAGLDLSLPMLAEAICLGSVRCIRGMPWLCLSRPLPSISLL